MNEIPTESDGIPFKDAGQNPEGDADKIERADGGEDDCFGPPLEPCECYCLHCGRVFMSNLMWFQRIINGGRGLNGFWMCPTANCDGKGFTFDIFPTDPDHPANEGWSSVDDEAEGDEEWDEDGDDVPVFEAKEWNPEETDYANLDQEDWEGEEWKLGLEPGEHPPEPQWRIDARKEWEAEQRKYDEPDLRPRVEDWSDRQDSKGIASDTNEDDIPF